MSQIQLPENYRLMHNINKQYFIHRYDKDNSVHVSVGYISKYYNDKHYTFEVWDVYEQLWVERAQAHRLEDLEKIINAFINLGEL